MCPDIKGHSSSQCPTNYRPGHAKQSGEDKENRQNNILEKTSIYFLNLISLIITILGTRKSLMGKSIEERRALIKEKLMIKKEEENRDGYEEEIEEKRETLKRKNGIFCLLIATLVSL